MWHECRLPDEIDLFNGESGSMCLGSGKEVGVDACEVCCTLKVEMWNLGDGIEDIVVRMG